MPEIVSNSNINSLYNESSGGTVVTHIGEEKSSNNTSDNFLYKKRQNNNFLSLAFKNRELESDFEIITKRRKQEREENIGFENVYPFYDGKNRELVKVKKINIKIKIGNEKRNDNNILADKNLFTLRKLNGFRSTNEVIDYPFSFNYYDFYSKSNRIDVFSNISKLQRTESFVDSLRGFKGNSLNCSNTAFGENNQVKNYFTKLDSSFFHYEDNIIPGFLYNSLNKTIVEKITKIVNPTTLISVPSIVYKNKRIISQESRYFAFEEKPTRAFYDSSFNKNDESIQSNRYILTNTDINDKILNNKNINNAINEKILYSSHGRDCDYSMSNGRDSLAYSGALN